MARAWYKYGCISAGVPCTLAYKQDMPYIRLLTRTTWAQYYRTSCWFRNGQSGNENLLLMTRFPCQFQSITFYIHPTSS
jgi:hypothetical protein